VVHGRASATIALALAALLTARAARADGTPTEPPPATGGTPTQPPPPPAARPVSGGLVRVHLRAYKNRDVARLYVQQGPDRWALACSSPCKVDLAPGALVRVTLGDDYDEPHDFSLQTEGGREIELEVRPASKGALAGGIVMTSLGGITMLVGLVLVAVAGSSSTAVTNKDGLRTAGGVCLALGGGLTIGGILLMVNRSHEPRVQQQSYDALRGSAEDDAPRRSALAPLGASIPTPLSVGFVF
jgi:hypothetical protein